MRRPMGMVMAMVKVPQGLPLRALTTMRPTTASRMTMMRKTVMSETKPPTLPISSRAIWPSVLPLRRMEQQRIVKSCTARQHGSEEDPEHAGQIAELRGEGGADERTRVRRWRRSDGRAESICWWVRNRARRAGVRRVWRGGHRAPSLWRR